MNDRLQTATPTDQGQPGRQAGSATDRAADRPGDRDGRPVADQAHRPRADRKADRKTDRADRKADRRADRRADQERKAGRPRRLGRLVALIHRPGLTVDQRADRALTVQAGRRGLPGGYGVAFGALVGTTLTAGIASFLFSFGNVRALASYLGVPGWIQPLVSPAVDVSVVGLIVVVQYLVMAGVDRKTLRPANRLLIGAGCAMVLANVAPSVVLAAFTYSTDHSAAGKLYGRALFEAIVPGILVAWSHVGPKLVRLFAEIRANADQSALDHVERRTLATEADRDQAAADRAAAADQLVAARVEADRILAAARTTAQAATDQAQAADRARQLADQAAADHADQVRRDADRAARRLADEAAADREQAAADRAAATERARQVADQRAALEAEADRIAAARRDAQDLEAEALRLLDRPTTDRPTPRARRLQSVPANSTSASGTGATSGSRISADRNRERAETIKASFPNWATEPPSKTEIAQKIGNIKPTVGYEVRRLLIEDAKALAGAATQAGDADEKTA